MCRVAGLDVVRVVSPVNTLQWQLQIHANILISETNAKSDFKDLSVLGKFRCS